MRTTVTLTGRLTADPKLRYSASGSPVARSTVVTSRRIRDKISGELVFAGKWPPVTGASARCSRPAPPAGRRLARPR